MSASGAGAQETLGAVKGFNDIRPNAAQGHLDSALWQRMIAVSHEVLGAYGFSPVWLPLVESTSLFVRGIGDETDVVAKEMYSFADRGGRSLTLRPEGTAGAARAYIEHHLARNEPLQRWSYVGPMFRAERPQKGRYRQFYQLGAELLGAAHPAADVELVLLVRALCAALGLPETVLRINTLGDAQSRQNFVAALSAFLTEHHDSLCESCQRRASTNPLRVLDCKNPACQAVLEGAPDVLDLLSDDSKRWFSEYQELLTAQDVPFVRERRLVRGLDYYSDAIFELTCPALGAQDALLGGGRYDRLIQTLGGPKTPAVGFAAGLERLALVVEKTLSPVPGVDLFIAPQQAGLMAAALQLAEQVRRLGRRVELDTSGGKLKQAMRRADRSRAQYVIVLGEREMEQKEVTLKRLRDGEVKQVPLVAQALADALGIS